MDNFTYTTRQLSVVTWKDVRADVLNVNKSLSKIIDDINPGDDYKFIKVAYLYGDIFVKQGELQVPVDNILKPLSDPSIDKTVQQELTYDPVPLFLILAKNSEVYFDTAKRIIPISLLHSGDLSGTYEILDHVLGRKSKPIIWNFAAGSRSIFMVPKITNNSNLQRLSASYDLPNTFSVEHLLDHWEIFKCIAQNESVVPPWQNIILLFGRNWFRNIIKPTSKEWTKFSNYLFYTLLKHVDSTLEKTRFNIYWESFAEIISARRLKPKSYLFDQVKHLLAIVAGIFPAFVVMDNSQESAPSFLLQKVFVEKYALKHYVPTLMHTCLPSDEIIKPRYVYYSLSMPTLSGGSPLKKTTSTIINDMREIKFLIETLKERFISSDQYKALNAVIAKTNFDYFHHKDDFYNQVKASKVIPVEDISFTKDKKNFPTRKICSTSPFFSGCIRIETQG